MCSKCPPSACTRDLSSACCWSMHASMTHFLCCAKHSAGAAVAKYNTRLMITQHVEIISKLKINQLNKILLIYHPKTKLTSDIYYGQLEWVVSQFNNQFLQGNVAVDLRWGGIFYSSFFCSLSVTAEVKGLLKSVNICQSYSKNKSGNVLWTTVYLCHDWS